MKKRIISAILMAVVFVPMLIIGGTPFSIFMTGLAVLCLYELLHIRESRKDFPLIVKIFAYIAVMFYSLMNYKSSTFTYNVDYRVMSFLIFAFLSPMVFINNTKKYNINDALFLTGSVLFIGLSFNLLNIVRNYDLTYILYLLLITIMTDTFALVAGKLVGKHKLCPEISPNKTVEGLIGGTLMGVISATCFYTTVINATLPLVILILITTLLSLVGQLGDLVFSSIKRYYGKKDFSDLIPGHGGVLDRFDSLIFVALATILFLEIL